VISTLIIVCIAYFGHAFDVIDYLSPALVSGKIFTLIWVGLFSFLIVISFLRRSRLENLTIVLNVSSLVLLLMPFGSVVWNVVTEKGSNSIAEAPELFDLASLSTVKSNESDYPDVYFLIFDRYADNRTLDSIYAYDNSDFLDRLRQRGFYIADRSRANYTKTGHSLASSLNLRHLTDLSESIGPGSSNWKPVYALVQDNVVARFMKAHGYRYIHLGSWWGPTKQNPLADENYDALGFYAGLDISLNEFEKLLLEPLLPTRLAKHFLGQQPGGSRNHNNKRTNQFFRVQRKFEKLSTVRRDSEPLFVFAHMLVPHRPFVFFDDGQYKTLAQSRSLTRDENYIDQLTYTNKKIEELVEELLNRDPQPIIIIQADEGPFPPRYVADEENFDWRQATEEELRQKFRILNAIYFPDREYGNLYEDITPVNTFRVIFNRYFGLDLPLLPDKSYSFYSHSDLYSFFDVTEATK
jgi:hypothetical protein